MVIHKNLDSATLGIVAEVMSIEEGTGQNYGKARRLVLRYTDNGTNQQIAAECWNAPSLNKPQIYSKTSSLQEGDVIVAFIRRDMKSKRNYVLEMYEPGERVFPCNGKACYLGYISYADEGNLSGRSYTLVQTANTDTDADINLWNIFVFENCEKSLASLKTEDLIFIIARNDVKEKTTDTGKVVNTYIGEKITILDDHYFYPEKEKEEEGK